MKKVLCLILVVVMLVTAVPVAVAEGNTYEVGDIIQFGSYPQSKVTDDALIAELNALAPEWEDWTSYGYYSGSGSEGTMKKGDWMRYTDIMYSGNKYRGVKFTQYRPERTCDTSSYTNQNINGYYTNTVYWFNFDPVDWRILYPTTGLVMCETIIDSQPYSNTVYFKRGVSDSGYIYYNDSLCTNYASDYETSSIREWLNNDFYNTAFTDGEKKEINTTTLNNDGYYTLIGTTGYEKLDSNETKDKIFLLSYNEIRNSDFGFNSSASAEDKVRLAQGSDYAKSQGLYVYRSLGSTYNNNTTWLLRSPGRSSYYCCGVHCFGYSGDNYYLNVSLSGVRPALRFNLDSGIFNPEHTHSYSSYITAPTCTDQGYTTYTCECGNTYKADYVKENGHTFTNYISDGKATCVTDGSLIAKCDFCDAIDTKPEKGDHKFREDFIIDLDPTCTSEGQKSRHCLNCTEKTDVTVIGKLVHTYSSVITAPTCTAQGYTTFTCGCGDTYVGDYVDKLNHSYNIISNITPNCTEKGYNVYACSCGDSYNETIPAKGHNFDGSVCIDCGYDKADSCSCNCHKSGFEGFIWKILSFFYKLFRTNGTCSCGAAHY